MLEKASFLQMVLVLKFCALRIFVLHQELLVRGNSLFFFFLFERDF